jgi:DNA-binding beta-propeller fold protein YncE
MGCGELDNPVRLHVTADGSLLVVEKGNRRLQQFTVTGQHIRFVGVGLLTADITSCDSTADVIIVGQASSPSQQIAVFDYETGSFITGFGVLGCEVGNIAQVTGLNITPDGHTIIIAEALMNRVSMFTVLGQFERCICDSDCLNYPLDVCLASSGEIVVANSEEHEVVVLSASTFETVRKIGQEGDGDSEFHYPLALAAHNGKLYVLDCWSDRVQVFE